MSLLSHLPEDFVQYVWKHLAFDLHDLRCTDGRPLQLLHPGRLNRDQGPDFRQARLRLAGVEWHGHVEIHLSSEDWYRHGHHEDPQYDPTVLHVVLHSHGQPILRSDGTAIPELSLAGRIAPELLARYQTLHLAEDDIACSALVGALPALEKLNWVERLGIERMEQKALAMQARLAEGVQDWNQVLWEELLAMMGGPVNQAVFRLLAQRIPWRVMHRHRSDPLQAEALLFGAAGMLSGLPDDCDLYPQSLRAEWAFLRAKYDLDDSPLPVRFLRMRPAAFPTIRLAQTVQGLGQWPQWLDLLTPAGWQQLQAAPIGVSAYWRTHYRWGEASKASRKYLGTSQKAILIANVLIPLGFLYQRAHGQTDLYTWIEDGLTALPPEHNRHTRAFADLGFPLDHALHAQGLIQLRKQYCQPKRCLQCRLGQLLLRPSQGQTDQVQEPRTSYARARPSPVQSFKHSGKDSGMQIRALCHLPARPIV